MKRLLVFAHPSKNSFNYSLAQKIIQISEKNNIEIDFLDLYENPQPYLRYDNMDDLGFDEQRKNIQKRILEANELVFVYPIWWSDMPAILKNFFDQNFEAGFAYRYENGESIGLLGGRSARIFCTCGGDEKIYDEFLPVKTMIQEGILAFCAIETLSFKMFGNVRASQKNEKYLAEVEKLLN